MSVKKPELRRSHFVYRKEHPNPILVSGDLNYIMMLMDADRNLGYEGEYGLFSYETLLGSYALSDPDIMALRLSAELENILKEDCDELFRWGLRDDV